MTYGNERGLLSATFDASLIEPQQRGNALRQRLRSITSVDPLDPLDLKATLTSYSLGQMRVAEYTSSAAIYVRDDNSVEQERLNDHFLIQLLVSGDLYGSFENRAVSMHTGDIYVIDLSRPSMLRVGDCKFINVLIARHALCGDNMDLHGRLLPAGRLRNRMLTSHLLSLIDLLPHVTPLHGDALADVTVGLIQECFQVAPLTDKDSQRWTEILRQRVLAYIDCNINDMTLNATMICEMFHISRTHLYRLFPGGGGIQRYIRSRRLEAVAHDICSNPNKRLTQILDAHGFSNERQFQRAFLDRFEMTPSEFRQRQRVANSMNISDER